jgi:hypothetical protein
MNAQYANRHGYTDVTPFEVVRVISDKTIEVREMDAELDPTWKPEFHIGGFSAHCSNQREQRWNITSNPGNPVVRIRLGKKGWKSACGSRFSLNDKPIHFYDYNF